MSRHKKQCENKIGKTLLLCLKDIIIDKYDVLLYVKSKTRLQITYTKNRNRLQM